jgi:phosphatidate cytidylyltransferase
MEPDTPDDTSAAAEDDLAAHADEAGAGDGADARGTDPHGPDDADEATPESQRREDRHTGSLGRNLPLAIASGVVMAVVFLATLFWSPIAFLGFVAILIVIALLELDGAFRGQGLRPATPVAIGAGLVMHFGAYAGGASAQSLGLVLLVLGALAWVLLDPGRASATPARARADESTAPPAGAPTGDRPLGGASPAGPEAPGGYGDPAGGPRRVSGSLGATCLMTLWVPFLASFIALLLARENGPWFVMAAVALAVTSDIGAFGFGSRFGRHKLAPSVSPGKTWEGFLGGLATVLVLAALITSRLPGFDLPTALVFGFCVAVAGTVGDLAESLVKRDLGVKDLGRIIPGHGGIMDRVDAIVFALPTAHLVLLALGR